MSELWSDEFKQALDAAIEEDKKTVLRYVLSRISAKQRTIFPISGAMNLTIILDNGYAVTIEESSITEETPEPPASFSDHIKRKLPAWFLRDHESDLADANPKPPPTTAKKLEELASAIQRYANSDGQRILTAKDIPPLTNKANKP